MHDQLALASILTVWQGINELHSITPQLDKINMTSFSFLFQIVNAADTLSRILTKFVSLISYLPLNVDGIMTQIVTKLWPNEQCDS